MMQFETQRGPFPPINNFMAPVTNQGPCMPRYMPFPANHRNQAPPLRRYSQPQGHGAQVVSGLLGSLMAQGVISLNNQSRGRRDITSSQKAVNVPITLPSLIDSLLAQGVISHSPVVKDDKVAAVGCEFAGLELDVRRESVLNALYEGGLPRQCKSCGLRFKCQEEHSSHMDWHFKKNRMSKKSKKTRSRNCYVTTSVWLDKDARVEAMMLLSGAASPAADKKRKCSDEERAVPADEGQSRCALCNDAFVEFYNRETDEWMYKGAVYLNAPQGAAPEMDRSQLGPIVHVICCPETSQKRLRRS